MTTNRPLDIVLILPDERKQMTKAACGVIVGRDA